MLKNVWILSKKLQALALALAATPRASVEEEAKVALALSAKNQAESRAKSGGQKA